jgi:hypothetical protein
MSSRLNSPRLMIRSAVPPRARLLTQARDAPQSPEIEPRPRKVPLKLPFRRQPCSVNLLRVRRSRRRADSAS